MILELEQIQKILRSPAKQTVIAQADLMEQRLRFFSETQILTSDTRIPYNDFKEWVRGILSASDKFRVFEQLFQLPSPTVDVVENVYRELERVFDSRNASSTYQFSSAELLEDWTKYRETVLKEPQIWRTEGWHRMIVAPNSILVVDLNQDQFEKRPSPYFYWLDITQVVDYRLKERSTTEFEWIVFRQPDKKLAVFDSGSFRLFQLSDDDQIESLIVDNKHNLGYCPARFFWSESLNEANPDIKKNPITKELSNLAWLLFYLVSKRQLDTYAAYPIYSAFAQDCTYRNNETHDYCDGGFLRHEGENGDEWLLDENGDPLACPVCSHKRLTGPGSMIDVPIPDPQGGVADMRNPVSITTIDEKSLMYNVKELDRLEEKIVVSVVGTGGTVSEKEAINETQVAANFESKTSVLNNLKINFEEAQRFVEKTICKLRYDDDFISLNVSWGTEFYIFTVAELREQYQKAKASGATNAELTAKRQEIIEVEHRNNPTQLARMLLLLQLEPYANQTVQELVNLYDKGLIDKEDYMIKINFESLIMRFERENTDILEFGKDIDLKEKISLITQKLKEYVKEQKTIDRGEKGNGGPQGGAHGQEGDDGSQQ